jgi:hypothetical protein
MVRAARPGAIETGAQEEYVRAQKRIDETDVLRERLEGMMLGAAIGDALGSAFESLSSAEIAAIAGSAAVQEYTPVSPAR